MKVAALLDRADEGPLRCALRLGCTVAVRIGPPEEDELLVRALRAGAARAVRLWDPVLQEVDYLGLAQVLARLLQRLDCSLIVAGDDGRGAVGPALAERLSLPHLCAVLDAEVVKAEESEERLLLVRRRTGL